MRDRDLRKELSRIGIINEGSLGTIFPSHSYPNLIKRIEYLEASIIGLASALGMAEKHGGMRVVDFEKVEE